MAMKRWLPWVVGVSVLLNIVLILNLSGGGKTGRQMVSDAPILLQKIQAIGKLHTIRHTFERTGSLETFEEPNEGVAWIPGARQLVKGLTTNTVLMTLRGSVESGIDFKKVGLQIKDGTATVTLPDPETYEPQVNAELHDLKTGALWRDDEIQLKAISEAKRTFRDASLKLGARDQAMTEARTIIETTLKAGGVERVVFKDAQGREAASRALPAGTPSR